MTPHQHNIADFPHRVTHHCSSTSIRNILAYDGLDLSEAMVFGLGSGLGLIYVHGPDYSPTYRMNGRAPDLESKFYRNVGQPIDWAGRWQPELLAEWLDAGRPILAQTDIQHLPYYQPPVHFPAHGIVVVGFDSQHQTVDIADIFSDSLQTIPLDNFQAAVNCPSQPMMPEAYHWAAPPKLAEVVSAETIRRAISVVVDEMLQPTREDVGLPAMQRLAEDWPSWAEAEDWAWCARFAYQSMEKRGTGGGNFRYLYADFLAEAAAYLPELTTIQASQTMRQIGQQWQQLAHLCKTIFVEQTPARFNQVGELAQQLASQERALFESLRQVVA